MTAREFYRAVVKMRHWQRECEKLTRKDNNMKRLKELITSIKRNKSEDIEVRKTLLSIAERNSTIELERGLRASIKEWQRISNIIEYASLKKLRIRCCETLPILHEAPLDILPDERVEIALLIEKYYRDKEKELIEKIKSNI